MILAACDLDQTLVYSRRSAAAPVDDALCVEIYQGKPDLTAFPSGEARALHGIGAP